MLRKFKDRTSCPFWPLSLFGINPSRLLLLYREYLLCPCRNFSILKMCPLKFYLNSATRNNGFIIVVVGVGKRHWEEDNMERSDLEPFMICTICTSYIFLNLNMFSHTLIYWFFLVTDWAYGYYRQQRKLVEEIGWSYTGKHYCIMRFSRKFYWLFIYFYM